MQTTTNYVTDTTFWIDFFNLNHGDDAQISNVRSWANDVIAGGPSSIIVSPLILCEVIRRLYYYKNIDERKIRTVIRSILRSFQNIKVVPVTAASIHTIKEKLGRLPSNKEIDVGEFSLLSELIEIGRVLVSSDKVALAAYKFVDRVDPRYFPAHIIKAGQDFISS